MALKERLCRLDELAPNSARRFEVGGHKISIVRIDDDVYAIGDVCSHENVSLSEGEIHTGEKTIECWKHGSEFSLVTGEPETLPATKPVPVYDIRVDDGDVVVVIDG